MRKYFVSDHSTLGRGLFAAHRIYAGERVIVFRGQEFEVELCSELPAEHRDTAIQVSPCVWVASRFGRFINHSCNPSCGPIGSRTLVALRTLQEGEEITFDYSGTYHSDWSMVCKCGATNCRGRVEPWLHLARNTRQKLIREKKVTSWVLKEFGA